ncbi:hypothetical protein MPH_00033, partial [Macrophomina phaseolina MS6]
NRNSSRSSVDLPLPLSPTIATELPGLTSKVMSLKAGLRESYAKETLRKAMCPLQLTICAAPGLSTTVGCSWN